MPKSTPLSVATYRPGVNGHGSPHSPTEYGRTATSLFLRPPRLSMTLRASYRSMLAALRADAVRDALRVPGVVVRLEYLLHGDPVLGVVLDVPSDPGHAVLHGAADLPDDEGAGKRPVLDALYVAAGDREVADEVLAELP